MVFNFSNLHLLAVFLIALLSLHLINIRMRKLVDALDLPILEFNVFWKRVEERFGMEGYVVCLLFLDLFITVVLMQVDDVYVYGLLTGVVSFNLYHDLITYRDLGMCKSCKRQVCRETTSLCPIREKYARRPSG